MRTEMAASLIDRASSLTERMASHVNRLTPEQVDRWRGNAASGNEGKFSQRLEWTASATQPPYWWAPTLMELLDWTGSRTAASFEPLVEFALGRLATPVSPALRPAMATALHRTLTVVAEQTLSAEAELFQQAGWPGIFEKYPVLAKLMAIRIQFWVEEMDEFLGRLQRDLPRLQGAFGVLGDLVVLTSHHSDAHHRGRTVKMATFASGAKLVYKPKDLAIDEAWFRLVAWFNGRQKELRLRAPRVVAGNGYGWVEFVNAATCDTEADVERYYRNAGALVCLLYVLGGTDFHYENL
ncbi:MAG: type 2 lantipeptide synthetase LanM, partial [Bryobacterales bacterium]|nr:type 2 lantipeptide synthetase LanM [Bryobacterales bacterium]